MVMPSGQSHKSHFEIDFTRKSEFLSFYLLKLIIDIANAQDPEEMLISLAKRKYSISAQENGSPYEGRKIMRALVTGANTRMAYTVTKALFYKKVEVVLDTPGSISNIRIRDTKRMIL